MFLRKICIHTCNTIRKYAYFPMGIVMVTASYPEIIGHSVRVITVRGKTNQRREGVSSQYLNYTIPQVDVVRCHSKFIIMVGLMVVAIV